MKKFSVLLSLLLLLPVAHVDSAVGKVLCIMADGRVTVDDASSPCCGQAGCKRRLTLSSLGGRDAGNNSCGHCDDVPLVDAGLSFIPEDEADSKERLSGPATVLCYANEFLRGAKEAFGPLPPPAIKSTFVSIRTVTLII